MKFIEARWHGSGGNAAPTRIVIHDAEYPEKMTGAEDVAAYFQHVDRKASAHFVCDADSTVQCVLEADVAYHAPPNANSLGIELVGYAKQTTADWLDAFGVAMLRDQAAPLVRDLAARHSIPLVWLSVADLKAGKRGVTSHNNVSLAFGQSTHTDPGPNFPTDQFMAWVNQGDDMPLDAADKAFIKQTIHDEVQAVVSDNIRWLLGLDPYAGAGANVGGRLQAIQDAVDAGGGGGPSTVDIVHAIRDQFDKP